MLVIRFRLMVVDPSAPEKGVYRASFDIPTECLCSLARNAENIFQPSGARLPPVNTRDPHTIGTTKLSKSPGYTRRGGNNNRMPNVRTNPIRTRPISKKPVAIPEPDDHPVMNPDNFQSEIERLRGSLDGEDDKRGRDRAIGGRRPIRVRPNPQHPSWRPPPRQPSWREQQQAEQIYDADYDEKDLWTKSPFNGKKSHRNGDRRQGVSNVSPTAGSFTPLPTAMEESPIMNFGMLMNSNVNNDYLDEFPIHIASIGPKIRPSAMTTTSTTTISTTSTTTISTTITFSTTSTMPIASKKNFKPRIPSTIRPPSTTPPTPPPSKAPTNIPEPVKTGRPVDASVRRTPIRVMHPPKPSQAPKAIEQPETTTLKERVAPEEVSTKKTTRPPYDQQRRLAIQMKRDQYVSQFRTQKTTTATTTPAPATTAGSRLSYRATSKAPSRTRSSSRSHAENFHRNRLSDAMNPSPSNSMLNSMSAYEYEDFEEMQHEQYDYHQEEEVTAHPTVEIMRDTPIRHWPTKTLPPNWFETTMAPSTPEETPQPAEAKESRLTRPPFMPTRPRQEAAYTRKKDDEENEAPKNKDRFDPCVDGFASKKDFLKSGLYANDPKKMMEMLKKFKAKENEAKLKGKVLDGNCAPNTLELTKQEPENSDKVLKQEEKKPSSWRPSSPSRPRLYGGIGGKRNRDGPISSSSFFNRFASENAGTPGFRPPPAPNSPDSEKSKSIWETYKSGASKPRSRTTTASTTTPTTASTAKQESPSAGTKNGFWPTPRTWRPTRPPPKRYTTTPRSPRPRSSTVAPSTTKKEETSPTSSQDEDSSGSTSTSTFPAPRLDTSQFLFGGGGDDDGGQDEDVFRSAYVDLDRIPAGGRRNSEMSIDAPDVYYDYDDYGDVSNRNQMTDDSPPKVPIRQVLDIFQQLKLSFGRRSK